MPENIHFQDDSESDSDDSDAVIRKKDFKDLSSMIEDDDLQALTLKASLLADSLKVKMAESQNVDLTDEIETEATTNMSVESETPPKIMMV